MKNIFRKITAAAVAFVMVCASCIAAAAEGDYTVEDAYNECCEVYPEFAENVKAQGVTDEQILVFLNTIYEYLLNYKDVITEDNFDGYLLDAVNAAVSLRKNIAVRDAIMKAYSDAAVSALDGVIAPEFQPVYEMAKALIFNHGLLGTEPSSEATAPTDASTAPTEPSTAPTDASTAPTEPSTAPTDASTAPTEPSTAPTEAPTSAPTEPATSGTATGGPSSENPTSAPTDSTGSDEEDVTGEDGTQPPTESGTNEQAQPSVRFTDMASAAWAEEAVYALVEMGIISGYGDGTFLPNKSITRAEFAKIIVMASGRYDANATADFTDVKSSDWYYSYVASAKNLGLVNGRGDGTFDPNANITRADICTIVYRYIKSVNSEFGRNAAQASFSDFAKVPSYAVEAVTALSAAGIVSGMGNNMFEPLANATRAQSAKIVHGAIKAALQI